MKVAIIGGTGLLGSNLVKLFSQYDIKAFSRKSSSNIDAKFNNIVDFDNLKDQLSSYFDLWKPDIIINTIANVNLQKCEDNYDEAHKVNSEIAVKLAKISKKYSSYFIHISTDHFFNDNIQKHNESSKISLLNNYAKTKYNAEQEVVKYIDNFLIVRTNILGFRNTKIKSFFEWLLDSLKKQEQIQLYTNFFTSPISVNELGSILLKCYEKKLIGTYNIASKEVIDKYSFGIKVANYFGYITNNIKKSELRNDLKLKRALTLGLDVSKIEEDLGICMPTLDETIKKLYKENNE